MKPYLLVIGLLLGVVGETRSQTNYYSLVTNLWHQGAYTSVVALAQQRLAANDG